MNNPSLLTEVQLHQLLVTWNQTQTPYPHHLCIHQQVETYASCAPDTIAVVYDKQSLTYRELNAQANQLAHYLSTLGVKTGILVGIYVERSIDLIIGLLATLKAGGAYVPLDPLYPLARLALMAEDAKIHVLLTQSHLLNFLSTAHVPLVYLDQTDFSAYTTKNLPLTTTANNLAYVIYTSGSTGQPKGVAIPHRGVIRLLMATNYIDLQATDVVAQLSTYSFDAATFEIWGALLHGAKLVGFKRETLLSPSAFAQEIHAQQISVLLITTALFNQIVQAEPTAFSSLRYLLFGGETANPKWVKFLLEHAPPQQLIHAYGPTETTVIATYYPVTEISDEITTLPIGRPIANTTCYILDEQLQPLPPGVAGELYIGGEGLAQGYLHQPRLTAEKFIAHPFNTDSQACLYKTGDRARYLADGNIEFLGRLDRQIKLRGFRIELAEIETVLKQQPDVDDAWVTVHQGERLLAYLVVAPPLLKLTEVFTARLLANLKTLLPVYMVPSTIVLLETFPKTSNGKLDTAALPPPTRELLFDSDSQNCTPTESALIQLWQTVLQLKYVNLQDNFFVMGGHSLLAIQLLTRIKETLQVDVPLQQLFTHPTLVMLAQYIDQQQPIASPPLEPKAEKVDIFPLSINQQSFWLFEQLYANTPIFHIPFIFKLTGNLDLTTLTQALTDLAERYPSLRTTFTLTETGVPQQQCNPLTTWPIVVKDMQTSQMDVYLEQAIQRPFNLQTDLLLRVEVLRTAPQTALLLLVFHHLIIDGWSIGLFFKALSERYQMLLTDTTHLPNTYQYADFCAWQQHWLTSESAHIEKAFWQQQLRGTLPILELPTDYVRPPVQTYRGARQPISLSTELTMALRQLSQQQGVTLFMTVLAAFKVLLYRYTGQTDLLVGTAVAGRQQTAWESIIGLFINNVVFRTYPTGQLIFSKYLQQVKQVALAVYQYQTLPFQLLLDTLTLERDLSHRPLFQCFFLLQNFELHDLTLSGLTVTSLPASTGTTKFDLTLELYEKSEGLSGWFEYSTDLFKAETIARLSGHFQTLLADIVKHPDSRLSALQLLTETEWHFLKTCGNAIHPTQDFIPFNTEAIEQSIPARFAQQVAQYPTQLALVTTNYQWSYQALDQRAQAIAYQLLERNSTVEEKVALLFAHSAPMIAALLGVLKAGKTYCPLDPEYPTARLQYVLQDIATEVILTDDKYVTQAEQLNMGQLTVINVLTLSSIDNNNTLPAVSPDSIAYLLYTSGSTGQPKGVIQTHRHVLHFIRNYTNNLHIHWRDRLTLLSAYGFDAAVMDIFGALLNGATLYPFALKEQGFMSLTQWLKQQQITLYHATPTVYRHFIETLTETDTFPTIRLVVLGGEAVYKHDFALYCQHFAEDCLFVNGFGPTESTVTSQYFMNKQTEQTQWAIPVGYPVAETEVCLVDEAGMETELYGEIMIKSSYVALGYWQQPALTEAVFSINPRDVTQRLYRTGDLGRLRADGSLEFVGRKDLQVKIRGYRIELGEIEAILVQHPTVVEAAVVFHETTQRLIAYTVQTSSSADIQDFLQDKLPAYMMPSDFVVLERLPLTATGKIDRRALPQPAQSLQMAHAVKPRDHLEKQLAQIWEQVLKVHPIGIHDNFFTLGGHSLLAITLLAQIEKILNKRVPLATLFREPTIARLAYHLRKIDKQTAWFILEPIEVTGSRPPLFFIGSTTFAHALAPLLAPEWPVYGLNIFGLQAVEASTLTIQSIAQRYIQEIQQVQPEGPYYLAGYCADAMIALEMAQQLYLQAQTVAFLAFIDTIWQAQHYHSRLYRHWCNLRLFGFDYLFYKMKRRLGASRIHFGLLLSQLGKKWYHFIGKPLPYDMQDRIFISHFYQAWQNYVPQIYPGHITLFLSTDWRLKYSPTLSELAVGGVEVHEISGYHDNLFDSPQIEVLGAQIKNCLEKTEIILGRVVS